MVRPLPFTSTGVPATFTRVRPGTGTAVGVEVSSGLDGTGLSSGSFAVAVATLSTEPAVSSASVIT